MFALLLPSGITATILLNMDEIGMIATMLYLLVSLVIELYGMIRRQWQKGKDEGLFSFITA